MSTPKKGKFGLRKRISDNNRDQGEIRDLMERLSIKYQLPYKVIREVVNSPYKCLSHFANKLDTADPNTFFQFKIKYIGTFNINKKHVRLSRARKGLPSDPGED